MRHKPKDITGVRLKVGDTVRIVGVPDLNGLPATSLAVFKFLVGKYKRISEFDEHGHAGIMFQIRKGRHKGMHWVALERYLLRLRKNLK
jgi:hypothetical protein